MALLDEAIEASGGLALWNRLTRFTLQLSIDGALLTQVSEAARFKDIVAEGCFRRRFVRLTGFADAGRSGVYRPDYVAIENSEGEVLRAWNNPHLAFQQEAEETFHEEPYLVFLCGFSIWDYLTTPFLLAHPGVQIEELPPWHEHDQPWRRLQAVFPPDLVAHSPAQTFYFDAAGLLRRTDHHLFGMKVANYSSAHQSFCGIVIPTLRRSLTRAADGTVMAKPSLLDVEIFDAAFE
jgi:hypothetical protein